MKRDFALAVCRGVTVIGALGCAITYAYQSSDADRFRALKEDAHQRDRVLQSLAAMRLMSRAPGNNLENLDELRFFGSLLRFDLPKSLQ